MDKSLDLLDKLHKEAGQLHALLQRDFDFEQSKENISSDQDSYLLWLARDQVDRLRQTLKSYDKSRHA